MRGTMLHLLGPLRLLQPIQYVKSQSHKMRAAKNHFLVEPMIMSPVDIAALIKDLMIYHWAKQECPQAIDDPLTKAKIRTENAIMCQQTLVGCNMCSKIICKLLRMI
ncbi:hypothetical protein CEXT_124431 [Caerostris extrusa]|uniref:Uncharacterized protein n=1 Tax=Caerostris extrusa TaxID=172846 RepID=A0AAV4SUE0_CAEEX|nr:hypothetical protein CEXT_124431 [Caerostris extrusa]